MSKWQQVKLGKLCSKIGSGATPKGGSTVYIDSGTALIRSQNVYNLSFEYSGLTYITEDAANKLSGVTIHKDDVLLNITGDSVARTCIVPLAVIPARVNQHVAILRVKQDVLNPRYLNYYLASPIMQAHMLGLAVGKGASRNAMTKGMIENFTVPLPPIEIQRKIADVLSAYDDLIENNRKQIKLLEEAAQRLYKEWFIDLRFPGYETTPIIDGVPKGWEKKNLESIIGYEIGGGWGSDVPTNTEEQQGYVIRGTDINGISNGDISMIPFRYHAKSNLSARVLKHGDIIFEVSGGSRTEGVGKILLLTEQLLSYYDAPVICASFCKLIRLSKLELSYYLGAALKYWRTIGRIGEFEKKSASSIINYRWKDFLTQQQILIPPQNIISYYNQIAGATYNKIIALSLMIEKAKQTRDRLLPKLITGELEVE